MTKPLLKRIIQLLKRHRDQQFVGPNRAELAPISVIITTLAGWAYAKCASQQVYADEFEFITSVIREMPTFIRIEVRSGERHYIVENETTAGENFADKWNIDQRRASAFYAWHADLLTSVESLLQIEGVDQFAESLSQKFGGKKDNVRDVIKVHCSHWSSTISRSAKYCTINRIDYVTDIWRSCSTKKYLFWRLRRRANGTKPKP